MAWKGLPVEYGRHKNKTRVTFQETFPQRSNAGLRLCPERASRTGNFGVFWARLLTAGLLAGLLCSCAGTHNRGSLAYQQVYGKPLLSSGTLFSSLPPAVQNTVRAETGSAELSEVIKDTNSGRIVYHIYFQNRDLLPPLFVAPDGSLLDPHFRVAIGAAQERTSIVTGGSATGLSLSDLPPAVVKSIQLQAPDAEVNSITKEVHGDQTAYLVSFKDGMHTALKVASDGTVQPNP